MTTTLYGFQWGPATVERTCTFQNKGGTYRVLQITAGRHPLTVYISPTGRSLRVFKDGREMR